jgi:hypothetical protein
MGGLLMPRFDRNRDEYVRQTERRYRWAWRVARLTQHLHVERRSLQAEAYDRVFRRDEDAVTYHYAVRNNHMPDFDEPRWVNEKVRWQYLKHPNPLLQIAADKVAVRDYLAFKGAEIPAPELYASGETGKDLLRADLPARFVLKSTAGWAQNIFVDETNPVSRRSLAASVAEWRAWDHWRFLGEMHYRGIPKRWLAEQTIGPVPLIREFKFYCILGEPMFVLYIADRDATKFNCAILDMKWQQTDFHWADHPATIQQPPRPAGFEQMIAEARRLSEDFLHVRVDFMECEGRLFFSELTFSGGGARNPFLPVLQNEALGERLDLGRAPELLERGTRIATALRRDPIAA